MLNTQKINHGVITYNAQQQVMDLDPGIATSEIQLEIAGTITVASQDVAATQLDDNMVPRLLRSVRVERDGDPLVRDIPARDMHQFWLRHVQNERTQTVPTLANLRANGTYSFSFRTGIPFATRWNRNPWETHLPPILARTGLKLIIDFETSTPSTSGASSAPGTGAFVDTGTGTYTFGTTPTVRVIQVGHPKRNTKSAPYGVRMYEQYRTAVFASANTALIHEIRTQRRSDLHLLRQVYGSKEILQNQINTVSLLASREEILRNLPDEFLRGEDAEIFPAVNSPTGYLTIMHAHGGNLSNILEPRNHTNLRYEFDVAAPTSGNGVIVMTHAQVVRSNAE